MRTNFKLPEFFLVAAILITSVSCKRNTPDFTIDKFQPVINWQEGVMHKSIVLDYTDAIDSGFIIPSVRQTAEGTFKFSFRIKNNSSRPHEFCYKIYYQNETYKYPEPFSPERMNPLAGENFYGSWENPDVLFKPTGIIPADGQWHEITDSFRITGNPRDEYEFYGNPRSERGYTAEEIEEMKQSIIQNTAWMDDIRKKASGRNIALEQQILDDALYALEMKRKGIRFNNRWKRNPRTGTYSFLLVVTKKEKLPMIPVYIQNIAIKVNERFLNPYWYFLYGPGKSNDDRLVLLSSSTLKVSARPDLSRGIFLNNDYLKHYGIPLNNAYLSSLCNNNPEQYHQAHFSQYFHHLMSEMSFKNIPVVKELQGREFTRTDYENFLKTYRPENMADASIGNTDCPCRDVYYDSLKKNMVISTPPAAPGKWKKTNAGIISRHGFTYGRFTAKIKFPELLNEHQMWNGLTNAFWMLNESNEEWNRLRECSRKGFIPKEHHGEFAPRVSSTSYSEIDIEIRKASPVWPVTSYNRPHRRPEYRGDDFEDIIVTCTLWDLACEQPKKFTSGTQFAEYGDQKILWHRWNPWYQAITTKHPVKDDELNKRDYYYYQIEWKPDTIVWRIGPEKDQLKVIGYIDASMTTIPNNQMLMIVTQEYHPSIWWPESPQLLEYIPFPLSPIKGSILEMEIE